MYNDCLLCRKISQKIFASESFFVVLDDFPVRQGHLLIFPIRHIEDLTLLTRAEFCDLRIVLQKMTTYITKTFQADGYNIGINMGKAAGQTVAHVHIHLISRRDGDVVDPRGGIRKFLPNPLTEYPLS